jgi:putative membrane protein
MLSHEDQIRIADAVTAAEETTSGEITCVLAQEVSNYREVPLAWAALAALGLPPLLVLAGFERLNLADRFTGWTDESLHAMEGMMMSALSAYALAQAVLFVAVALLVGLPSVRRRMTPGVLKRHRVRTVARHHYAASGYKLEPGVPHILIFASLKDRRVELVAHPAIHEKIGQGLWDEAVAAVTDGMKMGREADGFVRAIGLCGAAMAKHFPATGPKPNRLSNDIVQT